MKRIAVIITGGNIFIPKGLINAGINRAKYLADCSEYKIDVFNLKYECRPFSIRNLWQHSKDVKSVDIDGCHVRVLWKVEYCSHNWFLRKLLKAYYHCFSHKVSDWQWKWLGEYSHFFKSYNLLSVHTDVGAYFGQIVKKKYNIPYTVTWHGSDIHTAPFENESTRLRTVSAMEDAEYNFFVSEALLKISDRLTNQAKKTVLYNGVSDHFVKYDESKRRQLRQKYGVEGVKVVAFAGTLREIKNADLLPDIFVHIRDYYPGNVTFWIIGNGSLEKIIRSKIDVYGIDCTMWGFQETALMPDLLNCVDVLVLPSKNEGMPLVTLEAMSCGANVVGTRVGGIPEAIGEDFCVALDDNFVQSFAAKVVDVLNNPNTQSCGTCFSWCETAKKEDGIYRQILN